MKKTTVLLISLLCAGVFVGCTKTRNAEQQTVAVDTALVTVAVDTAWVDDVEIYYDTVPTMEEY